MLGQLQMKMIDIQTSLRKSTAQIEGLKREIQRSKLTDKEINTLSNETNMYSSVGRMYASHFFSFHISSFDFSRFVLNSKSQVREQIENKIKTCEDDIKKHEVRRACLQGNLSNIFFVLSF